MEISLRLRIDRIIVARRLQDRGMEYHHHIIAASIVMDLLRSVLDLGVPLHLKM
jgi:hypothetical protein